MHSKSDSIAIMINDEADKIIEELFQSLSGYQIGLEISMKGSGFVFVFIYCIKNVIKQIQIIVDHI